MMDNVDAEEARITDAMGPKTVEEVDALEEKLNAALDEVRARRDQIIRDQEEQGEEQQE